MAHGAVSLELKRETASVRREGCGGSSDKGQLVTRNKRQVHEGLETWAPGNFSLAFQEPGPPLSDHRQNTVSFSDG